jgi:hypothetical protein
MSEETRERKPSCPDQEKLMAVVQQHLLRIAELSHAISEALANRAENFAAELDKQLDLELGEKERAMGALHQHRQEHGC